MLQFLNLDQDFSGEEKPEPQEIEWGQLPFLALMFADEETLVAGGYDRTMQKFVLDGDDW